MAWTIAGTISAVATTLGATTGITRTQDYNEIGDTINDADCPLMQVYCNRLTCDPVTDTAQSTLTADMRQYEIPVMVDIYIGQHNQFAERMEDIFTIMNAVVNVLEAQTSNSKFGQSHIKSFSYTVERVLLTYNELSYDGMRFTITLRCW